MQMPANMKAPKMKLADGEEIVSTTSCLRKKGIFGNRFGDLHVTNQRVAFVKAIPKGAINAAIGLKGAKPMLAWTFDEISAATKEKPKKMPFLLIDSGQPKPERFMIADEAAVDGLIELISQKR